MITKESLEPYFLKMYSQAKLFFNRNVMSDQLNLSVILTADLTEVDLITKPVEEILTSVSDQINAKLPAVANRDKQIALLREKLDKYEAQFGKLE